MYFKFFAHLPDIETACIHRLAETPAKNSSFLKSRTARQCQKPDLLYFPAIRPRTADDSFSGKQSALCLSYFENSACTRSR